MDKRHKWKDEKGIGGEESDRYWTKMRNNCDSNNVRKTIGAILMI